MRKILLFALVLNAFSLFAQKDKIYPFKDNNTGKYGYRNEKSVIVPAQYDDAGYFYGQAKYAVITKGGKSGYIDKSGKEIIPPQYDNAHSFDNGYAIVRSGEKYGLINEKGEAVIPIVMDNITFFSSVKIASFKSGDKYGFYDAASGKEISEPQYEKVGWISKDRLFNVKKGGKWGYVDTKGREVISCTYNAGMEFSEARAAVSLNGDKYGFIDPSGKLVIAMEFDTVSSFYEGAVFVKKDRKWGLIDKSGKEVVPFKLDSIILNDIGNPAGVRTYTTGELYLLQMNGKEYHIKGCDNIFTEEYHPEGFMIGVKGTKRALIDKNCKLLTEAKYDSILLNPDNPSGIIAEVDGKKVLLNKEGKEVTGLYHDVFFEDDNVHVWIEEGGKVYKANVDGFKLPTPFAMQPVNDHTFADVYEVSIGDWLIFLTSQRGSESFSSLLPDTNMILPKCRSPFRVFFTGEEPEIIRFRTHALSGKHDLGVRVGTDIQVLNKVARFPITGITYSQAMAYCAWKTRLLDIEMHEEQTQLVYRLPTPEEWQSIAASGLRKGSIAPDTVNKDGCMMYNYHNIKACKVSQEMAKHRGDGTVYISDFWPSYLGICNMFGNAAEMTSVEGVAKGGSYAHYAVHCFPSEQQTYSGPQPWLGFRCVAEYRHRFRDKELVK